MVITKIIIIIIITTITIITIISIISIIMITTFSKTSTGIMEEISFNVSSVTIDN